MVFSSCVCTLAMFSGLVAGAIDSQPDQRLQTDVCVIGGGSGGFAAALAAARAGVDVVLVERMPCLGGTSTMGLVCNWEPGPGDPIARELYDRLKELHAASATRDHNPNRKQGPFGLWVPAPEVSYEQTLRRSDAPYAQCHGVVFDPDAMSRTMAGLLTETGRCRVLLQARFISANAAGSRVISVRAESVEGRVWQIEARVFIDATGNVDLCRAIGCETMLGAEPRSRFGEPSASEKANRELNAISLCYRVRKSEKPTPAPGPAVRVKGWPHAAHVNELPCGDLVINPLGVLPGSALIDLGYERAIEASKPIVMAHWQWLQRQGPFANYEFGKFAASLGIRESYRVVGEYVLTQHDLTDGLSHQKHDDIIAIADHSMDVHGSHQAKLSALPGPYGIPYRCLIPKGKENLLVACRGASLSQIAASSCRLSRTILAIGHAAGLAAAQAARSKTPVGAVDVAAIRKQIRLSETIADCERCRQTPSRVAP